MASTHDASSMASKLSLKLLIDTEADKVLFAEAGKEVVDFLFSLLSLSVGSVVKLLSKDRMAGSIANLYKSIEELDDTYLQNSKRKSTLFSYCSGYGSNVEGMLCPKCKMKMNKRLTYVKGDKEHDENQDVGYVKGVITYTIMDDLTVTPVSSISSVILLNKFNVKNLEALVERNVTLDCNEALNVLEISLRSKKVLTGVFLGKK